MATIWRADFTEKDRVILASQIVKPLRARFAMVEKMELQQSAYYGHHQIGALLTLLDTAVDRLARREYGQHGYAHVSPWEETTPELREEFTEQARAFLFGDSGAGRGGDA